MMPPKKKRVGSNTKVLIGQIRCKFPKLYRASKTKGVNGMPLKEGEPSEWATVLGLMKFADTDIVSMKQIEDSIEESSINQGLLQLVDQGILEMSF
jgi:hypothetical protein